MAEIAGATAGETGGGVVDGRVLRRVRNQEAVVEAMLELLDSGVAQPTAAQLSQQSGVSMRSIFRLFDDMEELHRIAVVRQAERVVPMLVDLPADGPLADRVDALVANRAKVFEAISPARRLGNRLAVTSPIIREELERIGRFFRNQVTTVFATELAALPQRNVRLDALDAATSWDAWERLRTRQDISVAGARKAMALTVCSLLEG